MNNRILITGASGLVGTYLVKKCLKEGYKISVLSREPATIEGADVFLWDIRNGMIDENCLNDVHTIIHLAGAPIAEKRWSQERKKEIIESRVKSTEMLFQLLQKKSNQVKHFIATSAVGYYGDRKDLWLSEEEKPGQDFLAQCCIEWENEAHKIEELGISIKILRFGIVLNKEKGSLPTIAKPIKLGLGACLGTGKQWVPWIHYDDLTGFICFLIQNSNLSGIYNTATPHPVTNQQLTHAIAQCLDKFVWPINIPKILLKLVLGERSSIVLNSNKTNSTKLLETGYEFKYPTIDSALKEIYG